MNSKFDLWVKWLWQLGGTYEFLRLPEEPKKVHDPPEKPTLREAEGYEKLATGWRKIQEEK